MGTGIAEGGGGGGVHLGVCAVAAQRVVRLQRSGHMSGAQLGEAKAGELGVGAGREAPAIGGKGGGLCRQIIAGRGGRGGREGKVSSGAHLEQVRPVLREPGAAVHDGTL